MTREDPTAFFTLHRDLPNVPVHDLVTLLCDGPLRQDRLRFRQ